jgi:Arc/MetJ family transcription regulator
MSKSTNYSDKSAGRVRKNMDMDAAKLAAAQRILGARTETETVDRALDYVVFQGDVFAALDSLVAAGGLDDLFEAPRRKVAERSPKPRG